ncbi:MAG: hypothetical protein HY926_07095 [Elusimicrobia bacterium]|nr:hypothetical protein [Elusimicrobiota bacterium]
MRQKNVMQKEFRQETARLAKAKETVAIDFPREGEAVDGPHYSFRVSAPQDTARVEFCVNQGPWLPCRQASGYWWFDSSDITPGLYQIRARMLGQDGTVRLTMLRRFTTGR